MSSGRQLAEKNVLAFNSWIASKTDSDLRPIVNRGVLSRKAIAQECGFAKSALDQNPRIKTALWELEQNLRARGVLPPLVERTSELQSPPHVRDSRQPSVTQDAEQFRQLENENADLKAEVTELKRSLERFSVLRDALVSTGRLPR